MDLFRSFLVLGLIGITVASCKEIYMNAWFYWHPFFMIVAFVLLGGSAIVAEKSSKMNITHVVLQVCAMGGSIFAFYVIYSNKIILGKNHFTSWHSWTGLACLALYLLNFVLGLLRHFPDLKTSKPASYFNIKQHKLLGRIAWAIALVACANGWYKLRAKILWFPASLLICFALLGNPFGWSVVKKMKLM